MSLQKTLPMEKLIVPAVSQTYPTLGKSYKHAGHEIEYSPRLVRTGKDYHASKAGITGGERMSTAAEELAIQLGLERAGQDPRTAGVFDDLFARNEPRIYMWQWTETGLRVPKGRDPRKYETNGQGEKYWVRELLIGSDTVGEILVPEGHGRVVVEWDEVSGLPRATEDIAFPHKPYTTHFWFNVNPGKDRVSGYQDVAVGRGGGWLRDEDARCLVVDASFARSDALSDGGFRPVRGSLVDIRN
ncbi:MAG: hypothetical protein HY516_04660 [Candidatus Aenigmarchaeota archaeon]|nr:hypothetical protein [Candidatus Aenigmarchaeota archaeon]